MSPLLQLVGQRSRHDRHAPRPAWARTVALLCALVLSLVSTAQACHTHPDRPQLVKHSQGGNPGNLPGNTPAPDHCPICIALHAAMPSAQSTAPVPVFVHQRLLLPALAARRAMAVPFSSFSRPPPPATSAACAAGWITSL